MFLEIETHAKKFPKKMKNKLLLLYFFSINLDLSLKILYCHVTIFIIKRDILPQNLSQDRGNFAINSLFFAPNIIYR